MRKSLRLGISLRFLSSITLTFALISLLTYLANSTLNRQVIENQAKNTARALAKVARLNIETKLSRLESATKTAASFLSTNANLKPSSYDYSYLRFLINQFPEIYGSAIAWEPALYQNQLIAPYVYRKDRELIDSNLNSKTYNYPAKAWYRLPKQSKKASWSPPYFDEGGGDVLMLTFSSPLFIGDDFSRFAGVITADISLDWLDQALNAEQLSLDSFVFLINKQGEYITKPKSLDGKSFFKALDLAEYESIVPKMLSGSQGFAEFDLEDGNKTDYFLYYESLDTYPWIIGVMTKKEDLLSGVYQLNRRNLLIALVGALSLVFVVYLLSIQITKRISQLSKITSKVASGDFNVEIPKDTNNDEISDLTDTFGQMRQQISDYVKRSLETAKTQQALESELDIAKQIQSGSLPKLVQPKLDNQINVRLHAWMRAAQKVGGDLYNFHWSDDRYLYVLIGDVSGKGISAAMFMVQIQVLAKALTVQLKDPAQILGELNRKICQDDACLFVTMILARLDSQTGELTLSNAGHDFPIVIEDGQRAKQLSDNSRSLACGLDEDAIYQNSRHILSENCLLVFYTDGISEAQNRDSELFGESRILDLLSSQRFVSPDELNHFLVNQVDGFAQGQSQADDIALICLKWSNSLKNQLFHWACNLDIGNLALLNQWLIDHVSSQETLNKLQLVFEELFVNACNYSNVKKNDLVPRVNVSLQLLSDGVCWKLAYPGKPFNLIEHKLKSTSVKIADSLDEMSEGGLGLFLVKEFSEELRYEHTSNINIVSGFIKY